MFQILIFSQTSKTLNGLLPINSFDFPSAGSDIERAGGICNG